MAANKQDRPRTDKAESHSHKCSPVTKQNFIEASLLASDA